MGEKMVTVAIMGKYAKKELLYALYTALNQSNIELELIVAMNELDFPACDAIEWINQNKTPNIKRILLHTETEITAEYNYFSYVKSVMQGEYLLCLRDGASLIGLDSLSKNIKTCDKIIMGRVIVVADDNSYIGDVVQVNSEAIEKDLHNVLNSDIPGSVILPKVFLQSPQCCEIKSLDELEIAIVNYLKVNNSSEPLIFSGEPLLRYKVNTTCESDDAYVMEVLEQRLDCWEHQVINGELRLNYTSYLELEQLITEIEGAKKPKKSIGKEIDARIQYIIKKQRNGKWDITQSDKAYITYLIRLFDFLLGQEVINYTEIQHMKANVSYVQKIKAVLLISDQFLWLSCYKSIYDAMIKNKNRYEVDIAYVPFEHNDIDIDLTAQREEWKKSGLEFKDAAVYRLDEESPDIVFFCKPYHVLDYRWDISEVAKIVRKTIYVPYNMAIMDNAIQRLTYQLPLHFMAWKQLVFSRQYQQLINENAYNPQNQLLVGHPKFDVSINDLTVDEQEQISMMRERANGRTIFLWNTRWTLHIEQGECGTFLDYGIKFLEYLQDASNIFVIWRPHPFFMNALSKYDCYASVLTMIENAQADGNMYLDQGSSQWVSIFSSDVLISDPSSIIGSYVPQKRPVILTLTRAEDTIIDEMVYKVTSFQELKDRVDYIVEGNDEMKERREKYLQENYFLPEAGRSVGEKVIEYIESNIL